MNKLMTSALAAGLMAASMNVNATSDADCWQNVTLVEAMAVALARATDKCMADKTDCAEYLRLTEESSALAKTISVAGCDRDAQERTVFATMRIKSTIGLSIAVAEFRLDMLKAERAAMLR